MTKTILVPVEPTPDMIEAHYIAHAKARNVFASAEDVWKAMLEAAPKPAPAEEEVVARAIFDWEKRGLGFDFEALDSGAKSQWLEAGKLVLSALAHHRC